MKTSSLSYRTLWLRRILFFFLIFNSIALSGQLPETGITLNVSNKKIEKVLEEISLQTGYFFTYDSRLIKENEKISLYLKDHPLEQALDSVFRDPQLQYKLIDRNIVVFRKNETGILKVSEDPESTIFRVKGIVNDKNTGEGLPFATVLINGTNKGTITNLQGSFSFVLPENMKDPILIVSMIGYKNNYFHVNEGSAENLVISLEKEVIPLQEVIIRYQNPSDILTRMLVKIPDNYLTEHSSMDAYFREYVKKNNDFITFSEAVINIAKKPYTNYLQTDNVKIIRGRKLNNISPEDSILLKIQSGINSSLQLDIIKNLPDFLSTSFSEFYNLEFRNIVSYRNQPVYLISFSPKEGLDISLYRGNLYINQGDLALVAAEFEIPNRDLRKNPERFLIKKSRKINIRPLKANYTVEYRKTEGKYHISMARAEVSFRLRKKRQWLSSLYDIVIEIAITDVQPGLKNRIPRRERLKPGTILSDQDFSYDPSFWGEYDIIEPEASLKEALGRMGIQWSDF